MNRRDSVLALVALGVAPLIVVAQHTKRIPVVGIVLTSPTHPHFQTLKQGLHEAGYVEGKSIIIETRFWEGQAERLPGLFEGLVRLNPDVIVISTAPPTSAAMRVTTSIPIIFVGVGGDPVALGLVRNLARPGGNVTGFTHMANDLSGKQLQILSESVPKISRVAVLINPSNPNKNYWGVIEQAAQAQRVTLTHVEVRDSKDLEHAFATMGRQKSVALLVSPDAFYFSQKERIASLAIASQLPAIFTQAEEAEAGGLISYGPDLGEQYRRVVSYVDKIIKGTKPIDLPVERAAVFRMTINLKTAKALGITIPQSVLLRADRVIE